MGLPLCTRPIPNPRAPAVLLLMAGCTAASCDAVGLMLAVLAGTEDGLLGDA